MENVMKNAWEIAYEGVVRFGGRVKEYFAEALKIAWGLFKGGKTLDYAKQVKGTVSPLETVKLEGSEKQVAWAEEIRRKAASELLHSDVFCEQYEVVSLLPGRKPEMQSRSVKKLFAALQSEEGIKAHFEDMKKASLPESRLESTVKSMNNALERYNRFTEIMSNSSAKFWIDNRDNQEKNHMFKLFKEYVNNGVKKF